VALVAAVVLRGTPAHRSRFFAIGAALTAWLLLDDLFTIHQHIAGAGYPKPALFGVLGLVTAWYFTTHWSIAFERPRAALLIAALVALGLSASLDLSPVEFIGRTLFEDAAKFIGISLWMSFYAVLAIDSMAAKTTTASV
jgi:hypothetical protein